MEVELEKQKCPKCKTIRLKTQFGIKRLDIPYTTCDVCRNTDKRYVQKNKDKIYNKNKSYRDNNKDKISLNRKKYYIDNKDTIKSKVKEYYEDQHQNNLDFIISEKIRKYVKNDKKYNRQIINNFYITNQWVKEKLDECNYRCPLCQKILKLTEFEKNDPDQFSIDRIHNIAAHHTFNCQILCWKCNHQKH